MIIFFRLLYEIEWVWKSYSGAESLWSWSKGKQHYVYKLLSRDWAQHCSQFIRDPLRELQTLPSLFPCFPLPHWVSHGPKIHLASDSMWLPLRQNVLHSPAPNPLCSWNGSLGNLSIKSMFSLQLSFQANTHPQELHSLEYRLLSVFNILYRWYMGPLSSPHAKSQFLLRYIYPLLPNGQPQLFFLPFSQDQDISQWEI